MLSRKQYLTFKTGDILIVAGKGHEKIQDIKKLKNYFLIKNKF